MYKALFAAILAALTLAASAGAGTDAPTRGLVYSVAENGDSEIVRLDATTLRHLTSNRSDDIQPRVSPDGRRVAFASDRAGSFDIYVVGADGKGVRRVTSRKGDELFPAWSPDGKRIVFASKDRTRAEEIYLVDATGGDLDRLTRTGKRVIDTHPAFSPDGRQIVFASDRRGENFDIYRLTLGDGRLEQLTRSEASDLLPDYSPDGRTIAFASDRGGNHQVWRMDSGGGTLRQVTGHKRTEATFPRFSSDGSRITYMTVPLSTGRTYVYTASAADGSNRQRVTLGEAPDW